MRNRDQSHGKGRTVCKDTGTLVRFKERGTPWMTTRVAVYPRTGTVKHRSVRVLPWSLDLGPRKYRFELRRIQTRELRLLNYSTVRSVAFTSACSPPTSVSPSLLFCSIHPRPYQHQPLHLSNPSIYHLSSELVKMIDPVEALLKTSSLLLPLPTLTSSKSVSPVPTVMPTSSPIVQQAGAVGHRTLW